MFFKIFFFPENGIVVAIVKLGVGGRKCMPLPCWKKCAEVLLLGYWKIFELPTIDYEYRFPSGNTELLGSNSIPTCDSSGIKSACAFFLQGSVSSCEVKVSPLRWTSAQLQFNGFKHPLPHWCCVKLSCFRENRINRATQPLLYEMACSRYWKFIWIVIDWVIVRYWMLLCLTTVLTLMAVGFLDFVECFVELHKFQPHLTNAAMCCAQVISFRNK